MRSRCKKSIKRHVSFFLNSKCTLKKLGNAVLHDAVLSQAISDDNAIAPTCIRTGRESAATHKRERRECEWRRDKFRTGGIYTALRQRYRNRLGRNWKTSRQHQERDFTTDPAYEPLCARKVVPSANWLLNSAICKLFPQVLGRFFSFFHKYFHIVQYIFSRTDLSRDLFEMIISRHQ